MTMWMVRHAVVLCPLLQFLLNSQATGHEPDQFTVPVGKEFADLGSFWNEMLYEAVHQSVENVNAKIRQAQRIPVTEVRQFRLAELQSPDTMAWEVRSRFSPSLWAIEDLEIGLRIGKERGRHPGQIIAYRSSLLGSIYSHVPLPPDPRQVNRMLFLRCSTIKVHGTYLGTDKIAHFMGMGHLYYKGYRRAIRAGKPHQEAMRSAQTIGRIGPLSEIGLVGYLPTGIYSNADMASNYVGLKFFVNLTDPVRLKGRRCPPMLVREGNFWRIQPHVRPDGPFFAMFISDHLDEVLNPSLYEWGMRGQVRNMIRNRRKTVLDWYAGDDPAKRNPAYFEKLIAEYATYYTEDYGHSGHREKLVTVANTCFDRHSPATGGFPGLVQRLPPTTNSTNPPARVHIESIVIEASHTAGATTKRF